MPRVFYKLVFSFLHNCIVHPLIPIADVALIMGYPFSQFSVSVDWLHDWTAMEMDR